MFQIIVDKCEKRFTSIASDEHDFSRTYEHDRITLYNEAKDFYTMVCKHMFAVNLSANDANIFEARRSRYERMAKELR